MILANTGVLSAVALATRANYPVSHRWRERAMMWAAEIEAVDSVATVHVEEDHVEGDEADE